MASIDLNRNKQSFGIENPYDKQDFFRVGMNLSFSVNNEAYTPRTPEENRSNWEKTYAIKNKTPEQSAQEKYDYARYDVSEGGIPSAVGEIIDGPGYGFVKYKLGPFRQIFKQNEEEVSPATFDQILAGLAGVIDGLRDYFDDSVLNYDYNEKENRREARTDEHGRGGHSDNTGFEGNKMGDIC